MEVSEEERHLSKLPRADGAAYNSRLWEHERQCLPETRVDLLEQITAWCTDSSGKRVYWLSGMAGTGKSTIARTVARNLHNEKRLGASFFFSRGQGDCSNATKLFTSIAFQLAYKIPDLKPYICRAVAENPEISQLRDQWNKLIVRPLCDLNETLPEVQQFFLIIDALDECEGDKDVRLILELLSQANIVSTVPLRVFITSRPEMHIHAGFGSLLQTTHKNFVLHDISKHIVDNDIRAFLWHELEIIRKESSLPCEWPGENNIQILCHRASQLFIYASTACRFIRDPDWSPKEGLSIILNDKYQELDEVYTGVLANSIKGRDRSKYSQVDKLREELRRIVASIVILFEALPVTDLAMLIGIPLENVRSRLRRLHSVLDIPNNNLSAIRLLHPSFRDFLLDQRRCVDSQFCINEQKAHSDLFENCLKLMSKHLQKDICNLQLPGALASEVSRDRINQCLPLAVQYACCYWVKHLQQSSIELRNNGQVLEFLRNHFLHWLEALSLLGKMSDGVLAVKALESILAVSNATVLCLSYTLIHCSPNPMQTII